MSSPRIIYVEAGEQVRVRVVPVGWSRNFREWDMQSNPSALLLAFDHMTIEAADPQISLVHRAITARVAPPCTLMERARKLEARANAAETEAAVLRSALEAAHYWLTEEAGNLGQTRPDEILRVINAALSAPPQKGLPELADANHKDQRS